MSAPSRRVVVRFTKPKEISKPDRAPLAAERRPGVVVVEGYLGEDGYFEPARLVQGDATNRSLVFSAFAVSSLTRYRPGMSNKCGVPLTMHFSSTIWR